MTELSHTDLKATADVPVAPIYLVHGEEMLCERACRAVVARLLGPEASSHQVERLDGSAGGAMAEALARVRTFSLLAEPKLVRISETRVFHDRMDSGVYLQKARQALVEDRWPQAARALLTVLSFHQLPLDEVDEAARHRLLEDAGLDADDDRWLATLVSGCQQRGMRVPPPEDDAALLIRALEKGFPAGNHLVLTTVAVDRRRKLYKAIAAAGAVVDCSVPGGDRKADRDVQQRVLQDQARRICAARGKRLQPKAFGLLVEMTGFDLRTFSGNLEKLMDYVGDRDEIGPDDLRRLLRRTRKDPIYALTGAVGERRFDAAMASLASLLGGDTHPLQALAAIVNHVRRLMLARSFLDAPEGRCWRRGIDYAGFQRQVVPALREFDRQNKERTAAWRREIEGEEDAGRKGRRSVDTDLVLVKNPKSVYPVYSLLKQAEGFSAETLDRIVQRLAETDRGLKRSEAPARWLLESLLGFICRREDRG